MIGRNQSVNHARRCRICFIVIVLLYSCGKVDSQDKEPPKMDPNAPTNFIVAVNQKVTLTCPFQTNFFKWRSANMPYISATEKTFDFTAPPTPQLNIFNCTGINGFGKVSKTLKVKVVDPDSPNFKQECAPMLAGGSRKLGPCFLKYYTTDQLRIYGVRGGSAELDCDAVSTVQTIHNWQVILFGPDGSKGRGSSQAHDIKAGAKLMLTKLTPRMAGEYRCVVIGAGNQRIIRTFNVSVKESGQQLIVGQRTENITVDRNTDVQLRCKATKEYGLPVVRWSKRIEPYLQTQYENQGHKVISSARGIFLLLTSPVTNLTTNEGTFIMNNLRIPSADADNSGEYLCTVFTTKGLTDMKIVNLHIDTKGSKVKSGNNLMVIILVALIVLILCIGVVIFFIIRRKQGNRALLTNGNGSNNGHSRAGMGQPNYPYYPGQPMGGGGDHMHAGGGYTPGVPVTKNGGGVKNGGGSGSGNNNSSTHASSFAMEPHGGGMHHSDTPSPPTTMFYPPSNHYTPPINSQPPTNGYHYQGQA